EKEVKPDAQIYVPDAVLPKTARKPLATIGILAVLAAMFAIEQVAKVSDEGSGPLGLDTRTLFALGGMNKDALLHDHQWYRLFTAALLHADAAHIALNGLALWMSGVMLEMLIGPVWFVALFCLGALGGSLLGLVVNDANIVSIGASGAVMGLFAAAVALSMRFPEGKGRTQVQTSLLQVLIPSLIPLAYRSGEHVDIAAHLGGAIVGGFAGYGLMKIWPRDQEHLRFPGLGKAAAAVGVGCFVASLGFAKHAYAGYAAEAAFDAQELLVPDTSIPEDPETAVREVDTWGAKHPRDPRVHLYRALRMSEAGDNAGAEKELREGLTEREIFERAFPSGHVEWNLRGALSDILVEEGRVEEAKKEAGPICQADPAKTEEVGKSMRKMGLCD
ncbi:MAG TPA: rhomboid family intramembrane serine protease, partial [Polyangiaceae bacterium]